MEHSDLAGLPLKALTLLLANIGALLLLLLSGSHTSIAFENRCQVRLGSAHRLEETTLLPCWLTIAWLWLILDRSRLS
jgi:hypothetical protein